ncbi:MAG: EAL domain-containing protein [Chloroflexota bacterium]|nr:MAG: EAL domain-containing protein [Chloroflexota bacterium]
MNDTNANPGSPVLPIAAAEARILVIDDEPANTTILDRLLRQAGYTDVEITNDSRAAIETYERFRPDIVLLDLHMPEIDGYTILAEIADPQRLGIRPPVIVLTADATRNARERALRMGAADFITKPLDHLEVLLRIRIQLATRFLELELLSRNVNLELTVSELEEQLGDRERRERERLDRLETVRQALEPGMIRPVFQPIVNLATGQTVGFEALARFGVEPVRSPDVWFGMAGEVDLLEELELAAIREAVARIELLPPDTYLSLNLSPATAQAERFEAALRGLPGKRTVLEITEHARVPDYLALRAALAPFRASGARLAVDDAGAGFASLRHILDLEPDVIKLDISITRDVDTDRSRRALAAALASFGEEMGIQLIAEGIETRDELEALRALGVGHGQGYFIGRPAPQPAAPTWPPG